MIEIYDTTLRDGTQGEGVTFSVADKLRIAEKLDAFGVHYIEGGWPGSNPQDIEFFAQAKTPHVPPRAAGRVRLDPPEGHRRSTPTTRCGCCSTPSTPVVTIFGKTWMLHVREVLQTTPEENLAMIADTVRFLKAHGKFVVYDAEHAFDGCKDDREYALATWQAAEAGRRRLRHALRHQRRLAARRDRRDHAARARAAAGRSSASTRTTTSASAWRTRWPALDAGATHVQGTINGYGERTGNCNMTSVMPILQFKLKQADVPADVAAAAEGAVAVRRRDREHPAQPAPAVGGRGGVLAQGRHARERGPEGDPQLRAHRSGAGRQHAARARSATSPAAATS